MISLEKQTLRARMAEVLRELRMDERREKSTALAANLRPELAGMVFGFAPLNSEPDWLEGSEGVSLALPRVEEGRLVFYRVNGFEELVCGAFGVREPNGIADRRVPLENAAVVLVPGRAFDGEGGRLGRGGGFYDRLLAEPALTARRIGVAFACQVVGRVPLEPHDARVDSIVTEDGWLGPRSSGRGRD